MGFRKSVVAEKWVRGLIAAGCTIIVISTPHPAASQVADATSSDVPEMLVTAEFAKLTASDADEKDLLGKSVAISGDTIVAGALWDSHDGFVHAGSAYVFGRDFGGEDAWGQVAILTASDAAAGTYFGESVAISGNTVVVGARFNSSSGFNEAGSIYIFTRNTGGPNAWGQVVKLTPSDADTYDEFGCSVAINGDTVVVGAVRDDYSGLVNSGSAYVFKRDQNQMDVWGQVAKLTASDAESWDYFGESVAISGDTVVVGARHSSPSGLYEAGSAYIFMRDAGGPNAWGQVAILTASDALANDEFGASVAIDDDSVVVGVAESGGEKAYIFERDPGWGQVAILTASDAASNDGFGYSVAINRDTVVIGAEFEGLSGKANPGSAYIFMRNEGGTDAWGEAAKISASDGADEDRFGISVALDGTTVVIGADGDDHSEMTSPGSVYVFQMTHSSFPVFTDGFESSDTARWSDLEP